jgi:hypothetical protein
MRLKPVGSSYQPRIIVVYFMYRGNYTVRTGGCLPGVKLTTHLHILPRLRMVELYLQG